MKLLNQSFIYLFISIFVLVSLWSVIFYMNILDEIHDSIDDGLANSRLLILMKANSDTTILSKKDFDESNYSINEISSTEVFHAHKTYTDTLMYMLDEDELEPIRMLTTTFELHGKRYELKVISPMAEEDDLIEDLFYSIILLYIFLVISIVFVNNIVMQRLWNPFYRLLQHLVQFKLEQGQELPEIKTQTKEFKELKNAANALIKQSLETYRHQKQFIENASHELQTPLAITINKLELLLEKENLVAANAKEIADILQIVERLVRLNKSLLLLTKIENKQFFDNQIIDINKITQQQIDLLEEFAEFKNIKIQIIEQQPLTAEIDAALANILVSNLIRNAISHNINNGKIEIYISSKSLKICNTGKDVALNMEQVFKRFYKSSSDVTSTGLGLAIVHSICNLYKFKIQYSYQELHCFEIFFK